MDNISVLFVFEKETEETVFATSDFKYLKKHVFSINGGFESSELCIGCPLFIDDQPIEVTNVCGFLANQLHFEEWIEGEPFPYNYILRIAFKNK